MEEMYQPPKLQDIPVIAIKFIGGIVLDVLEKTIQTDIPEDYKGNYETT